MSIVDKIVRGTLKIDQGQPVLLKKIPYMMYPARSMAVLIQKIADQLDDDALFQLGYDAGMLAGKEFIDKLGWLGKSLLHRKKSLFRMFEVMGFGKIDVKYWNANKDMVVIHMTDHPVIEHAIKLYGKKEKSSLFYRGIYSAHTHFEFGIENCKFVETQSQTKGAKFFEWSFNYFDTKQKKKISSADE